ncbi:flavin-containing monooxygenase [Nocardia inohanensis]|uniref:flavin-containing monooxygenase n=1 Tax=Nocardia inohanensis TaxID=209246 RepID=UPI00082DAA61
MIPLHEVAVIGAGISGLGTAIKLREAGITDFVVLEKADSVGGVWRDNTYPGCAVDIPSIAYSYSFAPHDRWSRKFAPQPEILSYLRETADRFGVGEHLRLGVEVFEASWDGSRRCWVLDTSGGEIRARSLVAAAGPWHEPSLPDIDGLDSFPGPVFHTSRWDHDVDLTGQRVAIVGTGASAIQVVPSIAEQVAELHVLQRTPQWVVPKLEPARSRIARRLGVHRLRWVHEFNRRREELILELTNIAFNHRWGQAAFKWLGRRNIHAAIDDPGLRAALTPEWSVGCKRLLMSSDYYPALARPNVSVVSTGLTAVRGNTLIGEDDSKIEVDVVILATGFKILDMPIAGKVRGVDGRSLAEHWDGSPQAYLGTTVPGFPNLYILFGPNVSAVASGFLIVESQLQQVVQALAHLRRSGAVSLEVRAKVMRQFNNEVQAALRNTVYNSGGCRSYYFDKNGRNGFSWPWSARRLRRMTARFNPEDYVVTQA